MEAIQVIEEILSKVFKWHSFPVSLKAEAVLLKMSTFGIHGLGWLMVRT
jgi:hypothetical protein